MKRIIVFFAGICVGIALIAAAAFWGGWPLSFAIRQPDAATAAASKISTTHHGPERVDLDESQVRDAGIGLARVGGGTLKRHFLAPGSLVPDADHIGRVSVRVLATVAELRKRLGDSVEKGEIVAVIESREVADAKSEYLAARLTNDLRQTLFVRQKVLVETRAVSENEFLRTQLTANDAQIKLDGAGRSCSRWGCRRMKSPSCRTSRRKICASSFCAHRSPAASPNAASISAG